ncbi:hypothetical protein W075_04064 [Mycobacterium tuberculosis TB_RSA165]|nr:hypothetical protein W075_04064 [Mycobacterium tuberculosis TB_RSA165]
MIVSVFARPNSGVRLTVSFVVFGPTGRQTACRSVICAIGRHLRLGASPSSNAGSDLRTGRSGARSGGCKRARAWLAGGAVSTKAAPQAPSTAREIAPIALGDGVLAGQRITDRKGDHEAARGYPSARPSCGRAEPIEPQFVLLPAGRSARRPHRHRGVAVHISVQRGIAAEDTTAASPPAMAGVTQSAEPRHGICVRLSFCLTPNFHYACESVANSYLFRQIA